MIIVCGGCGKNQRATGTTVNGKRTGQQSETREQDTIQQSETREQDTYSAVKDNR